MSSASARPTRRERSSSSIPSTASVWDSNEASPQPVRAEASVIFTKSQRGGRRKYSMEAILVIFLFFFFFFLCLSFGRPGTGGFVYSWDGKDVVVFIQSESLYRESERDREPRKI